MTFGDEIIKIIATNENKSCKVLKHDIDYIIILGPELISVLQYFVLIGLLLAHIQVACRGVYRAG